MQGKIIAFTIIIALIAGGLFYVYYKYEKPAQNGLLDYTNVSIMASVEGEPIATGYMIMRDGFFYKEGKTLKDGFISVQVPVNSTYEFSSININNQRYYSAKKMTRITGKAPTRVELEIVSPGEISVKHVLEKTNNRALIEVSSSGPYNDLSYCIDWSPNILWASAENDTITQKQYVPRYVKCYDTGSSLLDSKYKIIINYKEWKNLNDEDFLKIYLLDKNIENGTVSYSGIGGSDIEYIISGIN